jgi:succinoglycan biosynthesis protein ExoM
MSDKFLTVAICTYNRSERIRPLVRSLRSLSCPVPYEILFVNNNSQDETEVILKELGKADGAPLRYVNERMQGIVPARNRALHESQHSDYIFFMDDDELPRPGLLNAVVQAFELDGADCVGGRVKVHFETEQRPRWLGDELLGFLAEVDYGDRPFWISDESTPVWTANAAFKTVLFANGLKFDNKYNREGKGVGGGEDQEMFKVLLKEGNRIRYRPDMMVEHFVETWRLKRWYFLKLHYLSGEKKGRWKSIEANRLIFGVPLFLFRQTVRHLWITFCMGLRGEPGKLRQAMNCAHAFGMVSGTWMRYRSHLRNCNINRLHN